MPIELNFEIILILVVLGVTIFLFVTELFRVDFTAILVMVALGIFNQFPNVNLFRILPISSLAFRPMQYCQSLQL